MTSKNHAKFSQSDGLKWYGTGPGFRAGCQSPPASGRGSRQGKTSTASPWSAKTALFSTIDTRSTKYAMKCQKPNMAKYGPYTRGGHRQRIRHQDGPRISTRSTASEYVQIRARAPHWHIYPSNNISGQIGPNFGLVWSSWQFVTRRNCLRPSDVFGILSKCRQPIDVQIMPHFRRGRARE